MLNGLQGGSIGLRVRVAVRSEHARQLIPGLVGTSGLVVDDRPGSLHSVGDACKDTRPHVAVVDLADFREVSTQRLRQLRRLAPDTRLLALRHTDPDSSVLFALLAGVDGVAATSDPPGVIAAAIQQLAAGRMWLDESTQRLVLRCLTSRLPVVLLTSREQAVLELLACGRTNREIGEKLALCGRTTKLYVSKVLHKLRATNRREAVANARAAGLLSAA